jgi:cysteine-S-conjugate beta-lyase
MQRADSLFADDAVPFELLRQRAFNLRWAELPPDVIALTAADSDFPVCDAVQEGLRQYVADGVFCYAPPEGLPLFRSAVAEWFREERGLDCDPDAVFATDGAAAAMAVVARATLRPGDEVLIPDPVDFLFAHTIGRVGAVPVRVPFTPSMTAEEYVAELSARLTARTRMLWLCNPHNPWGVVPSADWLAHVAAWAAEHGLRILSDEVWSDIVYPPHRCTMVAGLSPEIARLTTTVYGFSKNFGLAGLRIGCIVCTDPAWRAQIVAASDARSTVTGASVLSQVAAASALRDGRPWLQDFVAHLGAQRDYALQRLRSWPGVTVSPPQGTFVCFPDVTSIDPDAERLCARLLERARVARVPGTTRWFGPGATGHLRLSFATSRGVLGEAFDRLDPVMAEVMEDDGATGDRLLKPAGRAECHPGEYDAG